jgi:hypothetical protein
MGGRGVRRPSRRRVGPSLTASVPPRDRSPWENKVTLCIAACCVDSRHGIFRDKHDIRQRIVFSADSRIETDFVSHEHGIKVDELSARWLALFSGRVQDALDLMALYRLAFRDQGDNLTEHDVHDRLAEPFHQFYRRQLDSHCQAVLSISYERYLEFISVQPAAFRRNFATELEQLQTNVEMLLVGWVEPRLRIYHCSASGVRELLDFGIVGSGYYSAETILYRRNQSAGSSLSETAYTLYEAHQLTGGFVPGVSKQSSIGVVRYDWEAKALHVEMVVRDGTQFLEKRFEKFGPKKLTIGELNDSHLPKAFTAFPVTLGERPSGSSANGEQA